MSSLAVKTDAALLRTFVCIKIPDEHLEIIAGWVNARKKESEDIRWVSTANMHITLKFCGERSPDIIQALASNLENMKKEGPFSIYIEGVGGFPSLLKPRVVWTGIKGDIQRLHSVQREIEEAAFHAGIPVEERPYSPHLTLGRRSAASPLPEKTRKAMESDSLLLEPWTINEIILMQSELSRFGARYTPLGLFKI